MKWREGKVPNTHLLGLAVLSLVVFGVAERTARRELQPRYELKMSAVRDAVLSQRAIADELRRQGLTIDSTNDPWRTGLIGEEHTIITSDRGVNTAKVLATNPNAAAAFVDLLSRARVHKGDRVAIGLTGSMPGWNIAMLCACKAMDVTPVIIASVGASDWGANRPTLTWLDMERVLREADILPYRSVAASLGGGGDKGRGMAPAGRLSIRETIAANGVTLVDGGTLESNIATRMKIYAEHEGHDRYAAYINIGGGVASLGGSYNNEIIPSGYSRRLPPANYPIDAVINRMSRAGVRVINLTNVMWISKRYGLPVVVGPNPPEIGSGALFYKERYDITITSILTLLLAIVVFATIRLDLRHYVTRNPRQLEPGRST